MNRFLENFKLYTKEELSTEYLYACTRGELDTVKFLLHSPELKYHAELNTANGDALVCAAMRGHLDIVQYLLTSDELKTKIDIHSQTDMAITHACSEGHLNVVKYLLTSPELKEHANIHIKDDTPFKMACFYNRTKVINYLIFDFNIPYSSHIKTFLENYNHTTFQKLLELRTINENLNENLSLNNTLIKKNKL